MSSIRLPILLLISLGLLAGCASAPNPQPPSPPPDAWLRSMTSETGTIWPGIYLGNLPDGTPLEVGFDTNKFLRWRPGSLDMPPGNESVKPR